MLFLSRSILLFLFFFFFFFFNDTATTEIYTLSLHDALPIWATFSLNHPIMKTACDGFYYGRSEEHTSELQSLTNLVCRLLLEKKKNTKLAQPVYPLICRRPTVHRSERAT